MNNLTKDFGFSADDELYSIVTDNESAYSVSNLQEQFENWFSNKLKTVVYPQHSSFEPLSKIAIKAKPAGNAYDKLQKMVGLHEAKTMINQALDYYKAQKLFRDKGLAENSICMNMVFTGNPGTAKTTVARLFAQILRDNEVLSTGVFVETGRAGLVGKYVGWTANNVRDAFRRAAGGVLFIDEAYSLVDHKEGMYGDEAINTIVQEMENNREHTIVIFAGYADKMNEFLQRNPGLRSRVAIYLDFPDYNAEELYDITAITAEAQGFSLSENVKEKLLPIYDKAYLIENFGNGRYARNLFEKAKMKQASRIITQNIDYVTAKELTTLIADDFEIPVIEVKQERRSVGFI